MHQLTWLPISFWVHKNIVHHIISYYYEQTTCLCDGKRLLLVLLVQSQYSRDQSRQVLLQSCWLQHE